MGNNSRILNFNASNKQFHSKMEKNALPVMVEQACNICIDELDLKLKNMFEQADDFLFDMSEGAYDNSHFDAMRMLRIKKEGLARSFHQEMQNNFIQYLGKNSDYARSDNRNIETLSFENIALVEESDLEQGIAIDGMIKKARSANADELERIRTRLDTLISGQAITRENNPFEPVFICQAFKNASTTLDIDFKSLLVVYKLFERSVMAGLPAAYSTVNQFFIDKGVLPELRLQRQQAANQSNSGTTAGNLNTDPLINTAISQENAEYAQSNSAVGDSILGVIQGLLAQTRGTAASSASDLNQANNLSAQIPSQIELAPQIDTSQLIQALTNLQTSTAVSPTANENYVNGIRNALQGQLSISDKSIEPANLGQFNDDMIDIVSMLFDFILDDENLHLEIKSIIARLQIPMLKVGLVDRTFFSNRKHSARVLLNEIAHAGISWDPSDVDAKATLEKIESVIQVINADFVDDITLFDDLLADFRDFKHNSKRRADIFERRTREAEEGKAKAESARGLVNQELEKICKGMSLPKSAKQVLKTVWVHVLFLERLKDSKDGWERACAIAKLLVWSVQPVETAKDLEKLVSNVPKLVKNIRKGFDIISLSPIEASHLLDALEETHRDIIKRAQETIESESHEEILRLSPASLAELSSKSLSKGKSEFGSEHQAEQNWAEESEDKRKSPVETIEANDEIEIQDIGFTSAEIGQVEDKIVKQEVEIANIQLVEGLNAGQWVEIILQDKLQRCKLAAKISSSGKYIFVNRSGVKVAEYYTEALAAEFQSGNLKILDDEALFDRALESVISNLRSMKAQAS